MGSQSEELFLAFLLPTHSTGGFPSWWAARLEAPPALGADKMVVVGVSLHIPLNHATAAKLPLAELARAAHTEEKEQISRTLLRGESLLYP